jgi:hypothetical protein
VYRIVRAYCARSLSIQIAEDGELAIAIQTMVLMRSFLELLTLLDTTYPAPHNDDE